MRQLVLTYVPRVVLTLTAVDETACTDVCTVCGTYIDCVWYYVPRVVLTLTAVDETACTDVCTACGTYIDCGR